MCFHPPGFQRKLGGVFAKAWCLPPCGATRPSPWIPEGIQGVGAAETRPLLEHLGLLHEAVTLGEHSAVRRTHPGALLGRSWAGLRVVPVPCLLYLESGV